MEKSGFIRNSQVFLLGISIAVATILSSWILSKGLLEMMKFQKEVISVTGSAQQDIKSDLAVWRGAFSRREIELKSAYAKLGGDLEKVKKYVLKQGFAEKDVQVFQIVIKTLYQKNEKGNDTNAIEGYVLSQTVEVKSVDVDRIARLARESTALINDGVEFESGAPEYFYTKLDALKVEMLARATENAKERAKKMAKATGSRIGFMQQAKMGVFQITPVNSTEISDWGVNDTTSLEKKVTAVVNVSFTIR